MRVLVTGATGFLGGALVRHLAQNKIDVVAMGRNPERCAGLVKEGFQTVCHDLSEPFPTTIDVGRIDAIVHCAALSAATGPHKAFQQANVVGTNMIVGLAKALGVTRFVHISSPTIYFKMADALLVREDAVLPKPVNAYAATKRLAESSVMRAAEIGPVILRPRGLYGPGDTTLLPSLLRAAKRPLPLLRNGRACIDLTYIDDVVAAIMAALTAGQDMNGEVFNISGGEVLPVRDIVEMTCQSYGLTARWRPIPLVFALAFARLSESVTNAAPFLPPATITRYTLGLFAYQQSLDISKARQMLGWTPKVKLAEGLRRTRAAGAVI